MKEFQQRIFIFYLLSSVICLSHVSAGQPVVDLSGHFPQSNYTPFGYLDNPYHTAVINRSGVLRSVPPLGFGFWARPLPWPYGGSKFGFGLTRHCNYLSLLQLSLNVDGKRLHTLEDFSKNGIELNSQYHTKNMMSYNFRADGVVFRVMYFQADEHSLICLLEMTNTSDEKKDLTLHATNLYGDIYQGYWGLDGIVSAFDDKNEVAVSKFFADGDMFVLGADREPVSYKATIDDKQRDAWISNNDLTSMKDKYTNLRIHRKDLDNTESLGHMMSILSYEVSIDPDKTETMTLGLSRGFRQKTTIERFQKAIGNARSVLKDKLAEDERFYANAPVLTGDWPQAWRHGLIYHMETIRMNMHPPVGIYNHYWDGMQVHTPRVVLGESAIDSMCLSYADIEMAKDVLLGVFEDAVADNIPCSREDGSLNLICGNGKETGTAPIWGLPFHVIHSIYLRDLDNSWIKQLYPHMKSYIEWWLANRTDEEGWFHCACSWESGQDGSKRFRLGDVAASAEDVRTIDIEAAMANAIKNMVLFATVAGKQEDVNYWKKKADLRIRRTRDMFVDGRFRDFDAQTGEPIILKDYYSIMMLAPISLGIASQDQMDSSHEIFDYFQANYRFWLEWPSFLFPFSEAAWNAGRRELLGEVLINSGNGIFPGMDSREPLYVKAEDAPRLSEKYSYRLPGVAAEWWPYKRDNMWAGGCENYGWGATFPTLLIRNLIGFRETDDLETDRFHLCPALSNELFKRGKTYGISNLSFRGIKIDVHYKLLTDDKVEIELQCKSPDMITILVEDENGTIVAKADSYATTSAIKVVGKNYELYTVTVKHKKGR